MNELKYLQNGDIDVEEYNELRKSVGWRPINEERAQRDLEQNYYRVTVRNKERKLIGLARIVGNGGYYFSLVDVIVLPEYQHRGIGKTILKYIAKAMEDEKKEEDPILFTLIASPGKELFYQDLKMEKCPGETFGTALAKWL